MKIVEILKLEEIKIDFTGTTKDSVLNEMIDSFIGDSRVLDIEKVRTVVLEREKIMSTGVGNGFAIPHGKTNMVSEMVAGFGVLKNPIEFEALDGNPVNLIFLLIGQEDAVGQHIKMLSRISRIMNQENIRTKLANANSGEEILQIFDEQDSKYLELS
ncbi:MAG: PTS sugar transporter subunit IIA [Bacteroidetes bacterium]|nr:PTS sugar transporter subunit IIA [Bacteroidota bacterium]MBU1114308.1 PTS sugar transporter subunit IIA [Bacteroidota bacterium]MBU1797086.1 PTS sugar transporter subunit IIA [Bacteroidota bacterium]